MRMSPSGMSYFHSPLIGSNICKQTDNDFLNHGADFFPSNGLVQSSSLMTATLGRQAFGQVKAIIHERLKGHLGNSRIFQQDKK